MTATTTSTLPDKASPPEPQAVPSRGRSPEELLPWLPCNLALEVPVLAFTVKELLTMRPGSLVRTSYDQSADIPLLVNGVAMAWTEFELVGDSLAARITDLI